MDYHTYLHELRKACKLAKVEVAGDEVIGTHSLRRGAAMSMQEHGGRLCEILDAGDWNSKAFMVYLDKSKVEKEAVTSIIKDAIEEETDLDSDSEEESDSESE